MANPVLFDMVSFRPAVLGKTLCNRFLKSSTQKSLPDLRKAFLVSNNGRIYIGRGAGKKEGPASGLVKQKRESFDASCACRLAKQGGFHFPWDEAII